MAQDNHTPLSTGAAAQAATFNSVFSSLDSAIKKNNYAATAAPTTGDDTADGYTVGSRWIDVTNDRAYVAVDVTLGAAVWKELSSPASYLSLAISTPTNLGGLTLTYTGASGSGNSGQIGMVTNDGAAMGSTHRLGTLAFGGYDGGGVANSAYIISHATELWSDSARGSNLSFYTTPNGSTTLGLAAVIENNLDFTAQGNITTASGKVYQVAGVKVLGARNTGWTAPTATQSKAGFGNGATSTAIEQALSAVINALITHGIIGA